MAQAGGLPAGVIWLVESGPEREKTKMLSKQAQKFVDAGLVTTHTDGGGEHLASDFSVRLGNFSSRTENGVKVRDATLLQDGKYVASYDAATDEVYQ